ncbi:DUF1456 family protein, partial [Salmonella enterica subsp. enterica serovar Montevideo]|nr:DUF1456 family protein [Salmonella enterica subsp. enterica serovar Montevideo]
EPPVGDIHSGYWEIAKDGMYGVANRPNGTAHKYFASAPYKIAPEQIAIWLRKEEEEGFQRCPDIVLSSFLNGLIYEKRGKDEAA